MTPVPKADIARGDGAHVRTFIEGHCRHTKDGIAARAGELIVMRPFRPTSRAASSHGARTGAIGTVKP